MSPSNPQRQREPQRQSGAEPIAVYAADPYDWEEARALSEALGIAETVAIALVRRGHRTAEAARRFLAAEIRHPASAFAGIATARERIAAAIAAGRRITVHGDYDVDGIAATAILVSALRRAGADCDWLIPDRADDGYGLTEATVRRLAERGSALIVTADCGIGSAAEIRLAAELGMEAVVTDHHQPPGTLPACPIVHPAVCRYPFEGLCGAAVAHKLAAELVAGGAERDLDLVALATVADMVPLLDENRTLARLGIAELRRARRPGIRALCAVAGVEPEHLDEGDIAFRLAPRLNAAGRLYRADAGVELMLSEDPGRATAIARELDAANHERREIEREVRDAAEAALRELPAAEREAAGLVLAGDGWHQGVVGIVASRIAERHGRPALVLSVDADGRARGSGRAVPGFDLLAALEACAEHLDRFGGHRAAAGLELGATEIGAFRSAFARAAAEQIPAGAPAPAERIDAIVGAEALELGVAEQLADLGPFGVGNPGIRLLVPWARVGAVTPMGEGGRHARFRLQSGTASAGGVAFNANGALAAAAERPHDLTVRLELNHWRGAVEPRAVLDAARPGPLADAGGSPCACTPGADEDWWRAFERELGREPGALDLSAVGSEAPAVVEHPRRSAVALIAELLSSGARVLVVGADARRRAELATAAASPARFGARHAIVCGSCPGGLAGAPRATELPRLLLTDWGAVCSAEHLPDHYDHVVAVDPPPLAELELALGALTAARVHYAFSGAGDLPLLCWADEWQPRAALAEIYRGLGGGPLAGERLGELLVGSGRHRRRPESAARCVRVLIELGIAELEGERHDRELGVVSSKRTELDRSGAWGAYRVVYERGHEYLQSRTASW